MRPSRVPLSRTLVLGLSASVAAMLVSGAGPAAAGGPEGRAALAAPELISLPGAAVTGQMGLRLEPAPLSAFMASQIRDARTQLSRQRSTRGEASESVQRAATRGAFVGLGRAAAVDVLRRELPELAATTWESPLAHGKVVAYEGEYVARVRPPGALADTVIDSVLPLRATDASGQKVPVDVDMVDRGSAFAPKNAVVDTSLPKRLGEGVAFDALGLRVTLDGDPNAVGSLEGNQLFYAGAAPDSDFMLAPTPTGVSFKAQLRSERSPSEFGLGFTAPGKVFTTRITERGWAEVADSTGTVVLRVQPPVAWDADRHPVPTRYRADGAKLIVEVAHRGADIRYPLALDPVIDDQITWRGNPGIGIGGWYFGTLWPDRLFPGTNGAWGRGLYLVSGRNIELQHTMWSWWLYTAPGNSFVYRADFAYVRHDATSAGTPMCLTEGIFNLRQQDWERGGQWNTAGQPVGGSGPWTSCNTNFAEDYKTHCARPGCGEGGNPGNAVALQQWAYGTAPRPSEAYVYMPGAAVFLSDYEAPSLSVTPASSVVDVGDVALTFSASDPGLGIRTVEITSDTAWTEARTGASLIKFDCFGTAWSPCPTSTGPSTVMVGNLRAGTRYIRVKVTDAGGKVTSQDVPVVVGKYATGLSNEDGSKVPPEDMPTVPDDIGSSDPDPCVGDGCDARAALADHVQLVFGIHDQNLAGLGRPGAPADPNFDRLLGTPGTGVSSLRIVVPYDVVSRVCGVLTANANCAAGANGPTVCDRRDLETLDHQISAATSKGLMPLVSFEHIGYSRADCPNRYQPQTSQTTNPLPTDQQYKQAMSMFFARYGSQVTRLTAWNEPNHTTQPTQRWATRPPGWDMTVAPPPSTVHFGAAMAGRYWRYLRQACTRCVVGAGDFLTTSAVPFRWDSNWSTSYVRYLGKQPTVWAVHPYGDALLGGTRFLRAFVRGARPSTSKIWITEVGAIVKQNGADKPIPNQNDPVLTNRPAPAPAPLAGNTTPLVSQWSWANFGRFLNAFNRSDVSAGRVSRFYYYQWDGAPVWDTALRLTGETGDRAAARRTLLYCPFLTRVKGQTC